MVPPQCPTSALPTLQEGIASRAVGEVPRPYWTLCQLQSNCSWEEQDILPIPAELLPDHTAFRDMTRQSPHVAIGLWLLAHTSLLGHQGEKEIKQGVFRCH